MPLGSAVRDLNINTELLWTVECFVRVYVEENKGEEWSLRKAIDETPKTAYLIACLEDTASIANQLHDEYRTMILFGSRRSSCRMLRLRVSCRATVWL